MNAGKQYSHLATLPRQTGLRSSAAGWYPRCIRYADACIGIKVIKNGVSDPGYGPSTARAYYGSSSLTTTPIGTSMAIGVIYKIVFFNVFFPSAVRWHHHGRHPPLHNPQRIGFHHGDHVEMWRRHGDSNLGFRPSRSVSSL
jgi:hypothetical protein